MQKIIIILLQDKLFLYEETVNGRYKPKYLKGEDIVKWEDKPNLNIFRNLKNDLTDIYNYEDLSDICFDIIYHSVGTETLKLLSDSLLPCGGWQIYSSEKVLPELILKKKLLKPKSEIKVQYLYEVYSVTMDSNSQISFKKVNDNADVTLDIDEIALLIHSSNNSIGNSDTELALRKDLKQKDELILELQRRVAQLEANLTKMRLEYDALKVDFNEKESLIVYFTKTIKRQLEIKKNEVSREIIRAERPRQATKVANGRGTFSGIGGMINAMNTNLINAAGSMLKLEMTVKWKANDGQLVQQGEVLCSIKELYSDGKVHSSMDITSNKSGRLYRLKGQASYVSEDEIIGVISEDQDSRQEIEKWIKNFS